MNGGNSSQSDILLNKFGTNGAMNATQTAFLFDRMGISEWSYNGSGNKVNHFEFS